MTIETLSSKLAERMKSINPEKTSSVEVLTYGWMILFNTAAIVFGSFVIGWITGKVQEVMIELLAFALLRAISGGYHVKSSSMCILLSVSTFGILPFVPITSTWNVILIASSALLTAIFAPAGLGEQSNIPPKYYPLLKILSVGLILVSSSLFSQNSTLAKIYFIQSLTLLFARGGERN